MITNKEEDEIKNIISKFNDLKDNRSNIEIEFRFGTINNNGKYKSSVQKKTFFRLIDDLKNMKIYPRMEETKDEIYDNIRKTTSESGITWMKKENLYKKIFENYLFK